jgi:hypothetical protein
MREIGVMNAYKLTYDIKEDNVNSKNYGYIISKTKRFETFVEAVEYSRVIANLVGKPVIEGVENGK